MYPELKKWLRFLLRSYAAQRAGLSYAFAGTLTTCSLDLESWLRVNLRLGLKSVKKSMRQDWYAGLSLQEEYWISLLVLGQVMYIIPCHRWVALLFAVQQLPQCWMRQSSDQTSESANIPVRYKYWATHLTEALWPQFIFQHTNLAYDDDKVNLHHFSHGMMAQWWVFGLRQYTLWYRCTYILCLVNTIYIFFGMVPSVIWYTTVFDA